MTGHFGHRGYHGPNPDVGDQWMAYAVCRDEDPETFYPVGVGAAANNQAQKAKAVCARCPVVVACLFSALKHSSTEQHGVQAGLTADERKHWCRPHCRRGHDRSPENTGVTLGRPFCRPCRDVEVAEYWAEQRSVLAAELEAVAS